MLLPPAGEREPDLKDGKVIGSSLIGQNFTKPEYFHPRPSAAGNGLRRLGLQRIEPGADEQEADRSRQGGRRSGSGTKIPDYQGPIPADMVTASASGLDPHISPARRRVQAARVAKARGISVDQVNQLIAQFTEGAVSGFSASRASTC